MLKSFDRLSQRLRDPLLTVADVDALVSFVRARPDASRTPRDRTALRIFLRPGACARRLSVFAKPLCSWPDRGHDPFVARSRNRVPCWPISEVAARLIEVSLLGHCGPDLLTLSSSRFVQGFGC